MEFNKEDYDINGMQDEIRVDGLCAELLKAFYIDLVEEQKLDPEEASALAYGADYFLREFLVPVACDNLFSPAPGRVRQFGGHWYIVKNLEPNMAELSGFLEGTDAFYQHCFRQGTVSAETVEEVRKDCAALEFYSERIESFWAIEGGGYDEWKNGCPLED